MSIKNEAARLYLEPEVVQSEPKASIVLILASGIIIELAIDWVFFKSHLTRSISVLIIKQESSNLLINIRRKLDVFNSGTEDCTSSVIIYGLCPIWQPAALINFIGIHSNLPFLSIVEILKPFCLISNDHHT